MNPLCFIDDFKAEWDDCVLAELTPEEEVWSQYMTEAFTKFAIYGLVRFQYAIPVRVGYRSTILDGKVSC